MKGLLLALALLPGAAAAEEPVSGYAYMAPETRTLQDDDFENPGMLWVDIGQRLWAAPAATGGSCADCHGDVAGMHGVGTAYPKWNPAEGRIVSLEQQINLCRTTRQGESAFPYSSDDLNGITALVMLQSRGLPMDVAIDGPAAPAYARGKAYYETRRGQLNLSCVNCHVDSAGLRLKGEVVSQGQVNGFPIYRQLWQDIGSVGRMIAWCNDSVRAEPLAEGSQMAVELELYLRARGKGLLIETPAVRR